MVRRRLMVEGRVQGVFYRDSCRREAQRRGLAGRARNTADGGVEVVLEGEQPAVDEMVAWCRQGPSRAVVTAVRIMEEDPQGLRGFSVS